MELATSYDFVELKNFLWRLVDQFVVHIARLVSLPIPVTRHRRPFNIPHRNGGVVGGDKGLSIRALGD